MVLSFAILLLNVVFMPYLLAAAVPTVLLFLFIRHYYLKSAREIKRLEAMSKSECFVCKLFLSLHISCEMFSMTRYYMAR